MNELPLYWTDPTLLETRAKITGVRWNYVDGVRNLSIALESSPFYPGGGGQKPDRGSIDGLTIKGIRKEKSTPIYDLEWNDAVDSDYAIGNEVVCRVDPVFRRHSRQQHTGQHLISAALDRFGFDTVSVHLGDAYCGIEVDSSEISHDTIEKVSALCEAWIQSDRPVHSRYLKAADMQEMKLRRSLKADSRNENAAPIRIVEIDGVDRVGCGGVHLERTGEIRGIQFDDMEKIRGRIRLKWIIGDRLLQWLREAYTRERDLRRLLSAESRDIVERVGVLLKKSKNLDSALTRTEALLAAEWLNRRLDLASENIFVGRIPGGKAGISGALDLLKERKESRGVFMVGDETGEGKQPWAYFDNGVNAEAAQGFLAEFLGGTRQFSGGGRRPNWRGVVDTLSDGDLLDLKTALSSTGYFAE